ncbi:MAG TPA: hypothetical protein PK490_02395 [Prosthecobacter sp.]|nr:hypothetical protein [Prosthecobacter sp.]HRK13106.1 hypothetical protein [Prosthecobacter sp.]
MNAPEAPLARHRRLIAENDALILGPSLDNGREITARRTAIHLDAIAAWAAREWAERGCGRPFAVAAIGGTGRHEMTPCSDLDVAFLCDEAPDQSVFLCEMHRQTNGSREFLDEHGFTFHAATYQLDYVADLDAKAVTALLDLSPVFDPHDLTGRFRERLRVNHDAFAHFLHISEFWRARGGMHEDAHHAGKLDGFDIKAEALRDFQAGVWTLGGRRFRHSHEVHAILPPEDMAAYHLLLRVRAFVQLRRGTRMEPLPNGLHIEDRMRFEDFLAFGDLLGPDAAERDRFEFAAHARAALLNARRRVTRFARATIGRELLEGREVGRGIVYGMGGMRHTTAPGCVSPEEKSRAALDLLLEAQRHSLPIDPAELDSAFKDIENWLVPVPELGALFYEPRGSLASSLAHLARFPGAEERLFPGHAAFEVSVDERVMTEKKTLRGALLVEKFISLEKRRAAGLDLSETRAEGLPVDINLLDEVETARAAPDTMAAVKLALKIKRLPLMADDARRRADTRLSLGERYSSGFSGVPVEDYLERCFSNAGFLPETLELTRFLITHRRLLEDLVADGVNDKSKVDRLASVCGGTSRLRALFVFTRADRAGWKDNVTDPGNWFAIRELYKMTWERFHPPGNPLGILDQMLAGGMPEEDAEVMRDLGVSFFGGAYARHTSRFSGHLAALHQKRETEPLLRMLHDGASIILGIAANNIQGLAAAICHTLWTNGVPVFRSHLFSATNLGLALDFFHLRPGTAQPGREVLEKMRREIAAGPPSRAALPALPVSNMVMERRDSKVMRLRVWSPETSGGLLCMMTGLLYHALDAGIYALDSRAETDGTRLTILHSLPSRMTPENALARLRAETSLVA